MSQVVILLDQLLFYFIFVYGIDPFDSFVFLILIFFKEKGSYDNHPIQLILHLE